MADENEIRNELSEWKSPLSGLSRKVPFGADEAYLGALPEQLIAFVRSNIEAESSSQKKRRIAFPTWVKGIAAALVFVVSAYAVQQWWRPADPDRRLARELRNVDTNSIEAYLEQGGIDASSGLPVSDETAQAIADLEPADIRAYLNQFPVRESE